MSNELREAAQAVLHWYETARMDEGVASKFERLRKALAALEEEPVYHLRQYGDVSPAELDHFIKHGTLAAQSVTDSNQLINWIAVEDRLPTNSARVLVWGKRDGETKFLGLDYYGGGYWGLLHVTHWAELSDINPPGAKE